jgi:hypothetical protein
MERVIDALKTLKYRILEQDVKNGFITARSRLNIWSWTEKVIVNIDDCGHVRVESKCTLPTQVVDWGKNRRNVEKIFGLIA